MDVLCTDKTGTLTEAQHPARAATSTPHGRTARGCFELAYLNSALRDRPQEPARRGDPGARASSTSRRWRKLDEVPFDFERRRVSVLVEGDGERLLVVKGAPEDVLRLSTPTRPAPGERATAGRGGARAAHRRASSSWARRASARSASPAGPSDADHASAAVGDEAELVFAGFAVFLDPPKASAAGAVRALAAAGVAVKVLTGDNEQVTRHCLRRARRAGPTAC